MSCRLSQLYKARLENGTYVAVRSLALFRKYSIRNLKLRLDLLSKLRHPHLVALLGHCIDDGGHDDSTVNRVFLIYEYVPNGDFRTHLSGQGYITYYAYNYSHTLIYACICT